MANEKNLTPAEVLRLQDFVLDVLRIIDLDDTGVTDDLIESADVAAEILEIKVGKLPEEDEDDLLPI